MKKIALITLLALTAGNICTISQPILPKKKKSKEAAILRAVGGFLTTSAGIYVGNIGLTGIIIASMPENPLRKRQLSLASTQLGLSLILAKYGYETIQDALRDLDEIAQEATN